MAETYTVAEEAPTDQEPTTETLDTTVEQNPVESQTVAVEKSGDGLERGAEPTFSAETLDLARHYGLDPQDFKSEEAIKRQARYLDDQFASWQRQQPQERTPSSHPAQQEREPQKTPQPAQIDWEKLFPPDQYDDAHRNAFKAVAGQIEAQYSGPLGELRQQLAEARQELSAVTAHLRQQSTDGFTREMDDWFGKAPDHLKSKFGSGSMDGLRIPTQREARQQVVTEMVRLQQADLAAGRRTLTNAQYADRAAQILYPQENKAIARSEIVKELAGRKNAALAGANGKQSKSLTGEDKAWDTYSRKAKAYGLTLNDD